MRARLASTAAVAAAATLGLAACSSSRPVPPPTTAPSTTANVTTTVAPTTAPVTAPPTTAYAPAAPQPSPDSAAAALVADWAAGSRAAAARVAAPAAVATLFAAPYPSGGMQARGCTDPGTNPGTCTYANPATGSLYEFAVVRVAGGWYVSSVSVET